MRNDLPSYDHRTFSLKMKEFRISYRVLSEELIRNGQNLNKLSDFLKSNYTELTDDEITTVLKHVQKKFLSYFRKKWQESTRKSEWFRKKNEEWLKGTFKKYLKE